MILLVPISPEVPPRHLPKLWQGLVLILILTLAYSHIESTLEKDKAYVQGILKLTQNSGDGKAFGGNTQSYLSLRPLLRIAPAPADWDLKRLIQANFIHGSKIHLALNLIGAFAGARICATFLSFFWILVIFVGGGSFGLWLSILLSSTSSNYIPHVGASAGIFALIGTYYVYNFRFQTRYFFWFPTRHGTISFPTSWFLFFDVILLELVLSTTQFFPATSLDGVDHIAHVVGFAAGALIAVLFRYIQRWPEFIQTRSGLIYWRSLRPPPNYHPILTPYDTWLHCLEINPYNDQIKKKLFSLLQEHLSDLSDTKIYQAFEHITPSHVRRNPNQIGQLVKTLYREERAIPQRWFRETPYDTIIRIAKHMTIPSEEQGYLYRFVNDYRMALPTHSGFHAKIGLLLAKLGGIVPEPTPQQKNHVNRR